MSVKKLRAKHNWSQEQLATISGLSLRTVQRVEAGNKASLETLKSLASVFEVDISRLTENVTVIDKDAEEWKTVPIWVSFGMLGLKSRKTSMVLEKLSVCAGILGLVALFFYPKFSFLLAFWCSAYWQAICIRWIDNENLW